MKDHIALVIRNNSKVPFIKRSKSKKDLPDAWAFPSGTKEPNEKLTETAVREAKEELGIKVAPEKILATRELPEFQAKLHFMICNLDSGKPTIRDPKEISSMRWMTFEEFFDEYDDTQIGHGLIYLRKNPHIWKPYFKQ